MADIFGQSLPGKEVDSAYDGAFLMLAFILVDNGEGRVGRRAREDKGKILRWVRT
jgi:hypothetical protein